MSKFVRNTLASLCFLFVVSCADSKSSGKKTGAKDPTVTVNPSSSDGSSMCAALSRHPLGNGGEFAVFVQDLCGPAQRHQILRSSEYQYRGSGLPNIVTESSQQGANSQMRLWASMATPSDAVSMYNLMRLKLGNPSEFTKIYEYDNLITYDVLNNSGQAVAFRYKNDREDVVIGYEANSSFIEVVPGQIFAIATSLTKSLGTVKTFRGLQVINQSQNETEVFSLSDQLYDNNSDHNSTVSRSQKEFQNDMARSFRNSTKANQSNRFFGFSIK